ncbi:MAG: GDSL-type esterase/lipase family protein [Vulcanimicrobiaceae bacterium]
MNPWWRSALRFAVFLTLLAFTGFVTDGAAADVQLISKAEPLRVLTLGDSITAGVAAGGGAAQDGGYRGTLGDLLTQNGYHAVFVGTRSDYSANIQNRAHDGWPGYVLRSFPADPGPGQLYGSLTERALQQTHPDIVLLMAGTNDLMRLERRVPGYTLGNILHSMDMLLAEIFKIDPSVRVIVAPVVSSPRVSADTIAAFDGNLTTIAENYAKHGYRITIASEMQKSVPRDVAHFPDRIHPSGDGGYADVAQAWLEAIEQVTGSPKALPVAEQ